MSDIHGLDVAALDRARISRDSRFDGKFFIAVKTTGIYCRPVCPAPSPKKTNIRYYATAAAAAEAGFRPCLRCRPEAAPGTPAWLGTSAAVRRALRLIQDGELDRLSVDELAMKIGIGPRHLHRLFIQHVGASPLAVAQTRRLHFAKRLLDETRLPITEIALAAGFGSLRRFNDAFRKTYRRAPRDLRRMKPDANVAGDEVIMKLSYRPPYDWPQVRDFLATRAIPGVERVDERGYARTIATDHGHAIVSVQHLPTANALELRVRGAAPMSLFRISAAARRMFDLAADPIRIAAGFRSDPLLAPLVKARPGLRIPGAWDPFECAVRAVLGQQVSVAAARTLASRLVQRTGPSIDGGDGLTHLFPAPAALAAANLDGLGITGARIAALHALARATADGRLDFTAGVEDVAQAIAALPASANGRRSTSRCAHSASPMHFRPAISCCAGWPRATVRRSRSVRCSSARKAGGRGVATPSCTCGKRRRASRSPAPANCESGHLIDPARGACSEHASRRDRHAAFILPQA